MKRAKQKQATWIVGTLTLFFGYSVLATTLNLDGAGVWGLAVLPSLVVSVVVMFAMYSFFTRRTYRR